MPHQLQLPTPLTVECLAKRRERLVARLQGMGFFSPILIAAGTPPARTYAANTYNFRAHSHFLHLVGLGIEGAFLWLSGHDAKLYVPRQSAGDNIWCGPEASLEEISQTLGIEVRNLSEIKEDLGSELCAAATIPALHAETREKVAALLNRSATSLELARDHALAAAMVEERLYNDQAGLVAIEAASKLSAQMHLALAQKLKTGKLKNEADGVAEMLGYLTAQQSFFSFDPIVTTEGEYLHNPYHDRAIPNDALLLVDAGAEMPSGYAGDLTLTWPTTKKFSPLQADAYDVVFSAFSAALPKAQVGTEYRDVHEAALLALAQGLVDVGILSGDAHELVADNVISLFMPHGVGHLLGLDVHDMEDLGDLAGYAPGRVRSQKLGWASLRLNRPLKPGMVFTIEPGIYFNPEIFKNAEQFCELKGRLNHAKLEQFMPIHGIRIEENVCLTEKGQTKLSGLPRDRRSIEDVLN